MPTAGFTGATAVTEVTRQGTFGNAYLRRAVTHSGRIGQLDYFARDTYSGAGHDELEVRLQNGSLLTVRVKVVDDDLHATKRFVNAETGSNSNAGTSSGSPWQTFAHAVANAPANCTVIFKGRRSDGKRQVYNIPLASGNQATLAQNNVQLKADPADVALGSKPMIWVNGTQFRKYYDRDSGVWQSYGSRNIWQTTAQDLPIPAFISPLIPSTKPGRWIRALDYVNGGVAQLDNTVTSESTADTRFRYMGMATSRPGASNFGTTGRYYIRLENPVPGHLAGTGDDYHFAENGWSSPSLDAREVPIIFLASTAGSSGESGNTTIFHIGSHTGLRITNLEFFGGNIILNSTGATYRADGCFFVTSHGGWPSGVENGDSFGSLARCFEKTTCTIDFRRCHFENGAAPWVCWGECKGYQCSGATMRNQLVRGSFEGGVARFYDCVIQSFWFHLVWQNPFGNLKFYHCDLDGATSDGAYVGRPNPNPNMRHIRCIIKNASVHGGHSTQDAGWDNYQEYVYTFNLWLTTYRHSHNRGLYETPKISSRRPIVNHGSPYPGQAKVFMNNTCLSAPSMDTQSSADQPEGVPFGDIREGGPHKTFNNIAVLLAKSIIHSGGSNSGRDGFCAEMSASNESSATSSNECDYNHYWIQGSLDYLGSGRRTGLMILYRAGDSFTACTSISQIRSESDANGTRYEDNGSEGNPQLQGMLDGTLKWPEPWEKKMWMPTASTPSSIKTGGADLTSRTYYRDVDLFTEMQQTVSHPFKGCFDPRVPLLEQRVGPR
jgi:hypothetical protein